MEKEIWLPVEETFGRYLISNVGNVKNTKTGRILRPTSTSGYLSVALQVKVGLQRTFFIHRLVARYFCKGYQENLVVNHIDGNKLNNHYTNLEWVTGAENVKHAYSIGLNKGRTKKPILCVETGEIFCSVTDAGNSKCISAGNISKACRGDLKTTGGYTWRYVNETDVTSGRLSVICVETGEVFSSVLSASKIKGICTASIHKVCKGIYKTAGGYTWKYIEGEKY